MKKIKFQKLAFIFCLICCILVITHIIYPKNSVNSIETLVNTYQIGEVLAEDAALNIINSDGVSNVIIKEDLYLFKTGDGSYYQTKITEPFTLGLKLAGVTITPTSTSIWSNLFIYFLGVALLLLIFNNIFKIYKERKMIEAAENLAFASMQSMGMPPMAESDKKIDNSVKEQEKIKKVTFNDVQGIDELKPDLHRLVDCLKNPNKYIELGARMPKGMVLYGPPGTGKTLIAKALAGEAEVPFFSVCGSDFMEKYVGVGASRIRELYKEARKKAPCIIFIDEIDAIGGGRGEANSSEKDQTINALLAELDGFKSAENILTICATNRLDILDPALTRAGRFDLKLAVGLPDKDGREHILKLHSQNKKLNETVSISSIAKQTAGFSGAELESLLNESALIAADKNKQFIDSEDIENAFFKIVMEGNKKKHKQSESQAKLIAYHEAGHALVTKLITKIGVPTVTIVGSTSGAGGVTFMSRDDHKIDSKQDLRNDIKISYGGRAAEELFLGNSFDITIGASQDIKQATSVIKSYISNYGMGNKGLLDIKQLTTQYDIIEEATVLSNELYKETIDLLSENFSKLESLAEALIAKETLYEEDVDAILELKTIK